MRQRAAVERKSRDSRIHLADMGARENTTTLSGACTCPAPAVGHPGSDVIVREPTLEGYRPAFRSMNLASGRSPIIGRMLVPGADCDRVVRDIHDQV